jgi:hypothetical protein
MIVKRNAMRCGLGLLLATLCFGLALCRMANAGSYIVAQCSPGVFPGAPDAGFSASSSHYVTHVNCSPEAPGLQVVHSLNSGETGTVQGAYGNWVWTAPAGTYITGGSTFSRLATEDGQHGYLAVSPDAGAGLSYENQNDDQGHEAGIPPGNWRYLVARLQCTQPNEGSRCVGPASGAHTYVKQIRIQITDVVGPSLSVGGSLLSGGVLRGPQTLAVNASDQGSGIHSVQITVNGRPAGGDDLSASCNELGSLVTRLAPCPSSFAKTYSLDTAKAPFQEGSNSISVCVFDYAQSGTANDACQVHEVLVDNLCPGSPVGGGNTITAGFGNGKAHRTLAFRRKALIRGRLRDGASNPVAGAEVCVEGHTDLPSRGYHLIGTATTNANGGWSFKLYHGPSRDIRIAYRFGSFQTSAELVLHTRAKATLHLSRHRTKPHHRIYFSGEIAGPHCGRRVVVIRGTVPGAKRRFLVRRAKTDPLCHYHAAYAFSWPPAPTRFVFWTEVPEQSGYAYARGRSVVRYIRVRR